MNKLRFILMVFFSSVILLGTTPLSAEMSHTPYGNKDHRLDNYPEAPSLLEPSDLKKTMYLYRDL